MGDDTGGLIVPDVPQNAQVVEQLREYIRKRVGGVVEMTAEEYEEAKKVASVEQQRRNQLDALLQGTPYSSTPRLAGRADSKPVTSHKFGLSVGIEPVLPEVTVTAAPEGRLMQPVAAPPAAAVDGMIHGTSQSYPVPMSNDQYKQLFGGAAATGAAPAAAPAADQPPQPPRVGRVKGKKS